MFILLESYTDEIVAFLSNFILSANFTQSGEVDHRRGTRPDLRAITSRLYGKNAAFCYSFTF